MSEADILTIIDSIVEACRLAGVDPEVCLRPLMEVRSKSPLGKAIYDELELRDIRRNQRT
jgi:hypothetical protein